MLDGLRYAFTPIPLIHKILIKLKRDKAQVILVAPAWLRQLWFRILLDLSVACPRHFHHN